MIMHAFRCHLAIVVTVAALISYLNHRFVRLQASIAIMAASLIIAIIFLIIRAFGYNFLYPQVVTFVNGLYFHHLLMNFMLGLLLFAGALTINISHLRSQKWDIGLLATISTIVSTMLVGTAIYYVVVIFKLKLSYAQSLLFGALISPTDPIAVLATFKQVSAVGKLATIVCAESLFNDGVGVVLFTTIYAIAFVGHHFTIFNTALLFLHQSLGGVVYGLILGFITCWLIKPIDDHKVEIILTIALATGGYTLAQLLTVSGLLAMVTAGIVIGNYRHDQLMSTATRNYLNNFWEIIEELLNAMLFLIMGLEILIIQTSWLIVLVAIFAIAIVLLARYITVAIPFILLRYWRYHIPFSVCILTWGGLRGGLAIALALIIPHGPARDIILTMTYAVVLFAVLVQGLTIKPLILAMNQANSKRPQG